MDFPFSDPDDTFSNCVEILSNFAESKVTLLNRTHIMQYVKKLLIQSIYGFVGQYRNSNGNISNYNYRFANLGVWEVSYNGTLEDLSIQLELIKQTHYTVVDFNRRAQLDNIPCDYGSWLMFSVIDSETYIQREHYLEKQ